MGLTDDIKATAQKVADDVQDKAEDTVKDKANDLENKAHETKGYVKGKMDK